MFGTQAAKPGGSFSFAAPTTTTSTQSQLSIPTFSFGAPPNSSQQQQPQPQSQTGSLFNTGTQPQQQRSNSLFGGGLFGNSSSQPQQQSSNLFGGSTQNQQATGGLFGNTNTQGQQSSSLFGNTTTQAQPSTGIFGTSTQPQQQASSLFNTSQQNPNSGFGSLSQSQQQQAQRPFDQTLRFGQSQQGTAPALNGAQPLWEEGRGLGVYRSIPAQMGIVKDKWDPASLNSPLRAYLFQHVADETEALRYRPGPGEDENKWEEAVGRRPGPAWVPLIVRGFYELGKKAQIQMEAIQRCNMMLQEINTSLDIQLDTHRQKVSTRLAECRRRHQASSQRTLALAAKVQILRNRGYVMDNAEEELKAKLEKLGREVFDPSLNAREQEIWARMLGIRERAKRLKMEMDRIAPTTQNQEPLLDEETVKAAKQTLEAYDTQLRHLQKELQLVQTEFQDWEKMADGTQQSHTRKR